MIKCCLFDLDGTLLDTLDNINFHVGNTMTRLGKEPLTREECRSLVGDGARRLMKSALALRGITDPEECERIFCTYVKEYEANPFHLVKAYEGISELLSELKSRGIRLGVLSNKPDRAAKASIDLFFGGVFDIVYGNREDFPLKPDPTAGKAMLKELGVKAEETAFIGDLPQDVITGKNLGAALSIGVTWGFRSKEELSLAGADKLADSSDALLSFLV